MTDVGGPRRPGEPRRPGTPPHAFLACHAPALRAVAATLCRNSSECDDLVQDTFERALRHLWGNDEPVRYLRTWLVTILRNAFIDRVRRERAISADVDDYPAPDPEPQPVWAHVTTADVRAACAAIEEDLRAVFELHYLEGLRYREIAARLSIPENTVASRLFRARKAVRDQLLASSSEEAHREERVRTER
jgi:RNA polymerase sigma-70 factor, ECF subfamily